MSGLKKRDVIALCCAVTVFFILCQLAIFAFPREPWFDTSFSLETAHKLSVEGRIDWYNYDVHPPVYYAVLSVWEGLKPSGLTEYQWAQEMSVILGMMFFVIISVGLFELFGKHGMIAMILLSMSSTYIHFGTEPRMYMMLLVLISIIWYAVVVNRAKDDMVVIAAIAACGFVPWVHYFGVLAVVCILLMGGALWWRERSVRLRDVLLGLTVMLIAFTAAVLPMAISQRTRSFGMWYAEPNVFDWFGAQSFSFFMVDGMAGMPMVLILTLYFAFLGVCLWAMWRMLHIEVKTERGFVLMLMLGMVFVPLVYLLVIPPVMGDGFSRLYHHRLFLAVLWMYAAGLIVVTLDWANKCRKKWVSCAVMFGMVAITVLLLVSYYENGHQELTRVSQMTACGNMTIVHESAFSAVPYQYWARERGCGWRNVVSTNFSKEMMNAGGGDVLIEPILYDRGIPDGDFLYVNSSGAVPIPDGAEAKLLYQDDGVSLWTVLRKKQQV